MWKNKVDRKNLNGVKETYVVEGLNLDRLINTAKNRGLTLENLKKCSNRKLFVSLSLQDSKKFFALSKELCYNIKKIRQSGKTLFILKAYQRLGIMVGAIIFMLSTCFFSDLIYGFSFSGSGGVYQSQVLYCLNQMGVKQYARFSSFNFEKIEDEILAKNKNLSFVSITKVGNRLNIESSLAVDSVDRLNGNVYSLVSEVDGVVEKINVYRGTALVKNGDAVKKGDLLVDGYMTIKEQVVKINVLASVSIIANEQFLFTSNLDNQEEQAFLLAKANLLDKEIVEYSVIKTQNENQFEYITNVKYRYLIYVG